VPLGSRSAIERSVELSWINPMFHSTWAPLVQAAMAASIFPPRPLPWRTNVLPATYEVLVTEGRTLPTGNRTTLPLSMRWDTLARRRADVSTDPPHLDVAYARAPVGALSSPAPHSATSRTVLRGFDGPALLGLGGCRRARRWALQSNGSRCVTTSESYGRSHADAVARTRMRRARGCRGEAVGRCPRPGCSCCAAVTARSTRVGRSMSSAGLRATGPASRAATRPAGCPSSSSLRCRCSTALLLAARRHGSSACRGQRSSRCLAPIR
jgi:hypothetical protein